jgi:hypothetical protein
MYPARCATVHLDTGLLKADSYIRCRSHAVPMLFPCHAFPLRVKIVSFPFDLHSAAVFDSGIPWGSPAMPRICRSESDLLRPWQGRGRGTAWYVSISIGRPETARGRPARVRHCRRMAGKWQGRGRVPAGSRQGNELGTAWHV